MAYFERTKLTDSQGNLINPANDDNITLLKRILLLLKPLSIITGAGSNRLNVDVSTVSTVSTVTTVSTLSNVTNVANITTSIGGVTAFELMKSNNRQAYNNGTRSKISS